MRESAHCGYDCIMATESQRENQNLTVLFADVSESSRLYTQLGDVAARNAINASLAALAGLLPRFGGRLVKTLGDAIMCVFPSVAQGVNAAAEMQSVIADTSPGGYPLRMHMGLHAGSVLIENDDVFGDTVNAAAYLTNVAMAEQILLSESTAKQLPPDMENQVRRLFRPLLKGSIGESWIYQALWRANDMELTDVNLLASRVTHADSGSLLVSIGEIQVRVNRWRPLLTFGRDASNDIPISDQFTSRQHCSIRCTRSTFSLVDHSVNGTFVTFAGGDELPLLRSEIVIHGTGQLRLGRSRHDGADSSVVFFQHDRRSEARA